jgi:hypothetical protein
MVKTKISQLVLTEELNLLSVFVVLDLDLLIRDKSGQKQSGNLEGIWMSPTLICLGKISKLFPTCSFMFGVSN